MESRTNDLQTLTNTKAADFANELVNEPIALLELRNSDGIKGKQAQPAYALQRNQALTRGKGGYRSSSIPNVEDPNVGQCETSANLVARRIR
jgi:hypothetical protein